MWAWSLCTESFIPDIFYLSVSGRLIEKPAFSNKYRFIANFFKEAIGPLGLIGQMDPICREHPYKPAQSPSQQSGSWDGEEWEMHEI